jgi:hypothetical protein
MQGHQASGHDRGGHQDDPPAGGWTTLTAGTGVYAGTAGTDLLYLGSAGATVTVSAVEKLLGGAGTDVVTLSDAGSTLCVGNIETLTGGAGTDVVVIAATGATLAVSGIETLLGSGANDVVTVASGTIRYEARGAGAELTLAAGNGADQIVFSDDGHGGHGGHGGRGGAAFADSAAYNQVGNFQSGVDQLVLTGRLRARLDDDGDGVVDSASAASGGIDVSAAEAATLTTVVADLTDTDFASVRSAIGTLTNSAAGADVLVLANDGTDAGAYLVTDRNGDGVIAATEIKLLGLFINTGSLNAADIAYG